MEKVSMKTLKKTKGIGKKTIQRIRENAISNGEIRKMDIKEVGFPSKKYNAIYADPPWEYKESGSGSRVVGAHYDTMPIEKIKRLPVEELAADNCILFMWVTFPRLQEGIDLMESWGFPYYSLGFTWVKKNKKADTNFWGMGYYTRQNPELCLIGLKGKITPQVRDIHCVIEEKIREHSRKPDSVRKKIEKIVGDVDKIELFARESNCGWDVWGNETDKFN